MEIKEIGKVAEQVKELFEQGKDDETIATELKLPTQQVNSIRALLGLYRKTWVNVFEKFKKVHKNNTTEQYMIQFPIPHDKAKEIGLEWDNDYQYIAHCSKDEIRLEIMKREEV